MKASDWISVKDRLPRTADYVFVCRECNGERWTSLAAYVRFEESARWYDPQGFDIHDVTHWQKIVLPKTRKDDKGFDKIRVTEVKQRRFD